MNPKDILSAKSPGQAASAAGLALAMTVLLSALLMRTGHKRIGLMLLFFPSLLVFALFVLAAAMLLPNRGRGLQLALGFCMYGLAGFILALFEVGYLEGVLWHQPWGILLWPTIALIYLGPLWNWWPDHAE